MSNALPQYASTVQTCKARVNSFGSRYWAFFADPEFVIGMAGAEIQKSFRRVVLDPARGLILLMSPARAHERASELAGDIIKGVASLLGIPIVSLRSARWRRRQDPPNTGPEPDCCFYVGTRARSYLEAEARGEADADQFVLDNPPDIVVEVGVTNVDADKFRIYQDRRVPECWQVDRQKDDPTPSALFVSLPETGPPKALKASNMLPGITPQLFEDALRSVAHELDSQDALDAIRDVMVIHGAITLSTPPHDDGTQGGGFKPC